MDWLKPPTKKCMKHFNTHENQIQELFDFNKIKVLHIDVKFNLLGILTK